MQFEVTIVCGLQIIKKRLIVRKLFTSFQDQY